jgi:hypothetical protein
MDGEKIRYHGNLVYLLGYLFVYSRISAQYCTQQSQCLSTGTEGQKFKVRLFPFLFPSVCKSFIPFVGSTSWPR